MQKDEDGCGVACVAMLAGISYSQARSIMFGSEPVGLTSTSGLIDALVRLGRRPFNKRLSPLRGRNYRELKSDALLKVIRPGKWWFHWIVWDAKRERHLDPKQPAVKRPNVSSYLLFE
jgi:hypothetical protein